MKPRLLLLSDLWGKEKSEWMQHYTTFLQADFDIHFYDVCELGNVSKLMYSEESLHRQFVQGGIETAVERLLKLEKQRNNILAFSIGGTIAWKAILKGLKTDYFYAVSSTRLRHETEKPNCYTQLFFGQKDVHQPNLDWQHHIGITPNIFKNKAHMLYTEIECIEKICSIIKSTYHNK